MSVIKYILQEDWEASNCIPDEEGELLELENFLNMLEPELEGVIFDLDGVLIEVNGSGHQEPEIGMNVPEEYMEVLEDVKEKYRVCLVTNRMKFEGFDPEGLEEFFEVPVISETEPKPFPEIYEQALDELDVRNPERAVMVDDSTFYGIFGASNYGLKTFQVNQKRTRYDTKEMVGKKTADIVQKVIKGYDRLVK